MAQGYPVPLAGHEDEEKVAAALPGGFDVKKHFNGSALAPAYKAVYDKLLSGGDGLLAGIGKPQGALDVPATPGLGVPLAALGAAAGYGAVDAGVDAYRGWERDEDLNDAKGEYTALVQQLRKQGGLADLAEEYVKEAGVGEMVGEGIEATGLDNTVNKYVTGPYLAAAALAALGGGAAGYSFGKSRSQRKLIEQAMRQRAQRRLAGSTGSGSPDYVYTV